MSQDYNNTLNLPKTEFSMRGNLTQKEPVMLEEWAKDRTYYAMIEKNKEKLKEITLKKISLESNLDIEFLKQRLNKTEKVNTKEQVKIKNTKSGNLKYMAKEKKKIILKI